jgi:pimeloyl-ACP methyl ester carboxylesterase
MGEDWGERKRHKIMTQSIYKTTDGEAEIHALYDKYLARLNLLFESRMVNTSYGHTHVLQLGPKEAPPLVMLHGGNIINPLTLDWIKPLITCYRVYAPDTIGHPGKSAPVRLSPRDNSYGQWLVEVLDALDLEKPALMGGSYGAGILLKTAVTAPQRISQAILFIPSGIVSIPLKTMTAMIGSLAAYKIAPSTARLKRVLQPMFLDNPVDPAVLEVTEAAFRLTTIETAMPRNVTPAELAQFNAPTLVITAERDRLFPATAVSQRARDLFPNLVPAETIPGATHFLAPQFHADLNERCINFLEKTSAAVTAERFPPGD